MTLTDRNGDPFTGTPADLKRHNNKHCRRVLRVHLTASVRLAALLICVRG
jgi:hypothetical protein